MKKGLKVFAIMIIAFFGIVGFRWLSYVTNTITPYDEAGIGINRRMPMPLRKWGCDQLKTTFGNVLPPLGCEGKDQKSWL